MNNKFVHLTIFVLGWIGGVVGIGVGLYGLKQITYARPLPSHEPLVSEALGKVLVEMSGAVQQPGLYTLEYGARVGEAVSAAGGFHEQADASYLQHQLNLAEKVTDAQKIYVPFLQESQSLAEAPGSATAQTNAAVTTSGKLNINVASQKELEALPGIGEKTAQAIMEGRPFSSVNELLSLKILGQKVFDQIQNQLTAE